MRVRQVQPRASLRSVTRLTPLFSCTVVYSNFTPLVIILVGKRGVNVGLMHALLPEIRHKLESIRGVVGNA